MASSDNPINTVVGDYAPPVVVGVDSEPDNPTIRIFMSNKALFHQILNTIVYYGIGLAVDIAFISYNCFFLLHTAMGQLFSSSKDGICDVFLNFRGPDTRTGFTGNLFKALRQRGVATFMDDSGLMRGESITLSLPTAIQKSRIAIVVFSKNYAYSMNCLDELVLIFECYIKGKMWIWPVFYEVDPSEVKYQTGSYGEALAKHEQGRYKHHFKKVQEWRRALHQVADLLGWEFKHGGKLYEHELITNITTDVHRKLMDNAGFCIKGSVLGIRGMVTIDHQAAVTVESSQATVFATQAIQAQSPTSSSYQVSQELHPTGLTEDDDAEKMDAFYASPALSEEARQAWTTVEDFFSDDASVMLQPERWCALKTALEYLSKLSADDGMSTKMSMLIEEAFVFFRHWSEVCVEASTKIESTAAELQRAVELETSLECNNKQYWEVRAEEQMLLERLKSLGKRKRDIYERGKTLKNLKDELGENVPCLLREHGFRKETETRIKGGWSEFREKFKK